MKVGTTVGITLLSSILLWMTASRQAQSSETLHYIVNMTGEVEIKRTFWFGYRQASIGEALNSEDQLRIRNRSSARIRCGNLNIWVALPGERLVHEGCLSNRQVHPLFRRDLDLAPDRSGRTSGSR